jgi:hypothetical protein
MEREKGEELGLLKKKNKTNIRGRKRALVEILINIFGRGSWGGALLSD